MIPWLLWKDLRLTAPVLLAAAVLCVAPVVCMLALAYTMAPGSFPWAEAILAGAHFSQWLMLLTGALLGGNAFASEREDESRRFLMSLPARAQDVLFSKVIVTLIAFEGMWIANAAVMHVAVPFGMVGYREKLLGAASMPAIAAFSLMTLGFSWFWSVIVARPVTAALSGLLSGGLFLLVFHACTGSLIGKEGAAHGGSLPLIAALLGIAGFIGACGLFLLHDGRPFVRPLRSLARSAADRQKWRDAQDSAAPGHRPHAFAALVWKDWRLIRFPFFMGTLLIAAPYALAAYSAFSTGRPSETFARASTQSLWLCCPVFAVWGGHLVAAERRSRSNRFLDALPVARSRSAASKLVPAAAPALAILGVNAGLSVSFHSAAFLPAPIGEPGGFFEMTWPLLLWQQPSLLFALPAVGTPVICFGVAWLASARLVKPFLGIAIGAASAGAALVAWMAFSTSVQEQLRPWPAVLTFTAIGGLLAVIFVVWGFRYLAGRDVE